ncbi:hypothetical protein Srot_2091 [Segniliparus rotundus DSM 44985]|uniref:Putative zinc-finger domain-containing protein n=1 Tax=Segniliparus rotundus (strain ATCC BAA-972 / CDC 1076 / CIP 108378 / DSM 44985 / JCM 13578) TaxID=640132 RepID=D6Z9B6_SEGRD|nr:zf-HC2 domain-containing protein [Segniliparus rotundus]ADG98546.1 hypothetical protein Srot_2091 [Segniliparus rotundus DSM 44985]
MILPRNVEGGVAHWSRGSELILGTKSAPKNFWSVDHISFEAVAAYADGKLGEKASARAREHFQMCPECSEQLQAQMQARAALRHSPRVQVPSELLGTLCAIPSRTAVRADDFPAHDEKRRGGSAR